MRLLSKSAAKLRKLKRKQKPPITVAFNDFEEKHTND